MNRVFEPLVELELHDGGNLLGVYVPGLRYMAEADTLLARTLDDWLVNDLAKIIAEPEGTQPAQVSARGEVK